MPQHCSIGPSVSNDNKAAANTKLHGCDRPDFVIRPHTSSRPPEHSVRWSDIVVARNQIRDRPKSALTWSLLALRLVVPHRAMPADWRRSLRGFLGQAVLPTK